MTTKKNDIEATKNDLLRKRLGGVWDAYLEGAKRARELHDDNIMYFPLGAGLLVGASEAGWLRWAGRHALTKSAYDDARLMFRIGYSEVHALRLAELGVVDRPPETYAPQEGGSMSPAKTKSEAPKYTTPERAQRELLRLTLATAVPLWIAEFRTWTLADVNDLARNKLADVIASKGDVLQFGGKGCAEAFNALAKGIAALSFAPGGVTFMNERWSSVHPETENRERGGM